MSAKHYSDFEERLSYNGHAAPHFPGIFPPCMYINDLETAFQAHRDIRNYRLNLGERRGIGLGVRDNEVGGVYSPFSASETVGGGFLVEWQDGLVSRGRLDGNSGDDLAHIFAQARAAAYRDAAAAQFLGPQHPHDVPRWSDDVPPLFAERSGYGFEVIAQVQALAAELGVKNLHAGAGASLGESWLRTSQGLQLHDRTTACAFSASFDGILGDGDTWRTVISPAHVAAVIARLGQRVAQLRTDVAPASGDRTTVVLHPDVAASMLGYFVWGNLGGSSVFHGQSPFSRQDFAEQRQVFRPDMQLRVEPWLPLHPDGFAWTGEGVPAVPTEYIRDGCLVQPLLDLKYARRLGLSPNTPPGGARSVVLELGDRTTESALIPTLKDGLLVLRILGLHTQDRTSGNYALATSQALLIRDGRIAGRVRATFRGNFIAHLRDVGLQLVDFEGVYTPGLAFEGDVAWG